MEKQTAKVIDLAIVAGTLAFMVLAIIFIRQNIPKEEIIGSSLFSFKSGNIILIDDNLDFESPERIDAKDNLVINLKPGVYYWKIEDTISNDVVELKVENETNLKLKKTSDSYVVVNSGGELNVGVYERGRFTGNVILGSDGDDEISGIVYIGGENG